MKPGQINPYDNLTKPVIDRIKLVLIAAEVRLENAVGVADVNVQFGQVEAYKICIHHWEIENLNKSFILPSPIGEPICYPTRPSISEN